MPAPVSDQTITDISHVIQLSVAPVFLLTSIGTILGVMSNRLARIVDRARLLNERLETATEDRAPVIHQEMHTLARRRRLVNLGITFGTSAALLVCVSIATVFLGAVLKASVAVAVALLFILAMAAFVAALVCFLREVLLAVRSLVMA
jgi:membrane glycosyltransferase